MQAGLGISAADNGIEYWEANRLYGYNPYNNNDIRLAVARVGRDGSGTMNTLVSDNFLVAYRNPNNVTVSKITRAVRPIYKVSETAIIELPQTWTGEGTSENPYIMH